MDGTLLGGRGLVLRRGVPLDKNAIFAHIGHSRFKEYFTRWIDAGEIYLMYAIADSGLHFTFETSGLLSLLERVESVHAEFAARQKLCAFECHVGEAEAAQLSSIANQHKALSLLFKNKQTTPDDISVQRVETARFGYVLLVKVPANIVRHRDLASFLVVMDSLVKDLDSIQTNWMQLRLYFTGWEADLREHQEITQIQTFLRDVMLAAPWWLGVVHPSEYVKWFGALVRPVQVKDASGAVTRQFQAETLQPFSGIAALEAVHMLNSSAIEQGETRNVMAENLRTTVHQVESGFDLATLDPLAVFSEKTERGGTK